MQAIRRGVAPRLPSRPQLPGTVWTAFTDTPASRADAVRIIPSAGPPFFSDQSSSRVVLFATSAGRLDYADDASSFLGSSTLVAPRLALCPVHLVRRFADESPDSGWTMQRAVRVRFDPGNPNADRMVRRVLRTLRPQAGTHVDGGTLMPDELEKSWPVLLELSECASAAPLPISRDTPATGSRVRLRVPEGRRGRSGWHFRAAFQQRHRRSEARHAWNRAARRG